MSKKASPQQGSRMEPQVQVGHGTMGVLGMVEGRQGGSGSGNGEGSIGVYVGHR